MILCVTLNPCLDKTLTVPEWRPGDSVRGRSVHEVVGGKGNNVARALSRLGRRARPVTFFGGRVGTHCAALLKDADGLDPLVIASTAPTRVILTVRTESTAQQSAFFDPDPAISPDEADALFRAVEGALGEGPVEALTLSGSSPSEATHGLYTELIALGRSRKVPVFLDTYGPALEAIWGFWPDAIQLNRREAAAYLRKSSATDADVLGLLDDWARHGVRWGVVTNGPGSVFVRHQTRGYKATPPPISAVNPIGSGDCLLAGLVDAWLSGFSPDAAIRHALGCAVANALVWDAGSIDVDTARRQGDAVVIDPLPD
jgi:1-phosphofructokinase family hexose kinase